MDCDFEKNKDSWEFDVGIDSRDLLVVADLLQEQAEAQQFVSQFAVLLVC